MRWKNWKTNPIFAPRSRASASSPRLVMSVPSMLDAPSRGRVEAGHQPQQRGLAAARGPDDRQRLAVRDVEIDGVQDGERTPAARYRLRDAAQLNHEVAVAVSIGRNLAQTSAGDALGTGRVGMDAVGLIELGQAGHAVEQEREEGPRSCRARARRRPRETARV